MARDSIVNYTADDLFSSSGIGSLDKAIGLNAYGINFQQAPTLAPRNKEQPGYVFFTRPQLNMQSDNIKNMRTFYNLLSSDPLSQERLVRCLLDPRLGTEYRYITSVAPAVRSPLVDNENPFISILTNNCMTLTGWPEQTMTFQRSKEDVYRGTHTQPNGIVEINSSYTLTGTFRNSLGDPLIKLFHYWMMYMGYVTTTGQLRPYPDFEAMDIMDWNTRIYRIVLDSQRNKVTKIYATGAATPSANAVSSSADFNREEPISSTNKDLTFSFECDGMIVMDPILYYTFNGVVSAFCPGMHDAYREASMKKLTKFEQQFFKNVGYPRIDPQTSDFEVWVPMQLYNSQIARMQPLFNVIDRDGIDYEGVEDDTSEGTADITQVPSTSQVLED